MPDVRHAWWIAVWIAVLGLCHPPALAKTVTFKVATLAPEGSTWWKLFGEAAQAVRQRTAGRVRIRLYTGGVAGDESDVVRKMRVGRLHAAAITSVGLAEIQPQLLVLQAPGLFATWDELVHVRQKMGDKLATLLAEKGFVTLMWGDIGFNHIFSKTSVKTPEDLTATKIWCWTQDGVYQAYYRSLGVNPVLAGAPDVLPALQTGRLNAFAVPPLVAVSLQWFVHSGYMLDWPQTVNIGAVVVTEKSLARVSPADREAIFAVGDEYHKRLAASVRTENHRAVTAMQKNGVKVVTPDAAARAAWTRAAARGADAAAGKVFPAELLAEARRLVAEYRKQGAR